MGNRSAVVFDFSRKALAKLMHDHVEAAGVIEQVRETRPEWNDRDYHFDLRFAWSDRNIYVETILVDDDPKDPYIHVRKYP